MRTQKRSLAFGLGVLIFAALACNYSASTANISDLKLGKTKDANAPTNTFAEGETVYAVATVSNVPDKVKVTGRLAIEEVEGEQSGPIPGLENTLDLAGSGTATFTFTPPPTGWPKGKYKVEVMMLNEGGEQKDQKSASFTVS
ncbi:MAG TPA: hypothetical protein VN228_11035 [Pyrinomonadaceae bacterium]|nr:hypothetical protein [Pyrinomonadaceae bacterium]